MVKTRCQTAAIDTDTTIRTENARRFIAGDWFLQIKPLQASATACACVRKKRRYKISINHNLVYRQQDSGKCEMHITTPKTTAGCRTVPMLAEVRTALLQERKRQMKEGGSTAEIDGYTGFIFTNRFGYVHNPQTINRRP